ncbi:MAG: peptidoglycan binding domain-containing protein, partial [Armatimonadota bacterium]
MHSPILKWFLWLLVALIALLGIAAGVVAYEARSFRDSDLIARNLTIAGLPVGETRRADAIAKLQEQWLPTLPKALKLTHAERSFPISAEELGRQPQIEQAVDAAMKMGREDSLIAQVTTRVRLLKAPIDVPVGMTLDRAKAEAEVAQIAEELDRDPVNARVTLTGGDGVDVVPGKPGLQVDQA